jgi:serine/threonine protein kinase
MPVAGGWLTSLSEPSLHLWSVSQQLFEAFKFMHDHGVAHMDLKPSNIIIPLIYGQLTIIDFSLAVRLNAPQHTFVGFTGTEGYMAPEVGKATYNPIRADLWSCGKVRIGVISVDIG